MSDMRRREFVTLLSGAAAAWPLAARAQQAAMPLVGVMSPLSVSTAPRNLSALRNGLHVLVSFLVGVVSGMTRPAGALCQVPARRRAAAGRGA